MTLPPHIANAPTPRTDALNNICSSYEIFAAEYEQLERQLIWAEEVMEKLNTRLSQCQHMLWCELHADNIYSSQSNRCSCGLDEALTAINEYKQGTKEV